LEWAWAEGEGWVAVEDGHERGDSSMTVSDEELESIRRKKLKEMLQRLKKKEDKRMVRIVIPVAENRGIGSHLSDHFGRAPFFAVFELDEEGKIIDHKVVPNDTEHFGGVGLPPDRILQLKPDAVITYGMGPRALKYIPRS